MPLLTYLKFLTRERRPTKNIRVLGTPVKHASQRVRLPTFLGVGTHSLGMVSTFPVVKD